MPTVLFCRVEDANIAVGSTLVLKRNSQKSVKMVDKQFGDAEAVRAMLKSQNIVVDPLHCAICWFEKVA